MSQANRSLPGEVRLRQGAPSILQGGTARPLIVPDPATRAGTESPRPNRPSRSRGLIQVPGSSRPARNRPPRNRLRRRAAFSRETARALHLSPACTKACRVPRNSRGLPQANRARVGGSPARYEGKVRSGSLLPPSIVLPPHLLPPARRFRAAKKTTVTPAGEKSKIEKPGTVVFTHAGSGVQDLGSALK